MNSVSCRRRHSRRFTSLKRFLHLRHTTHRILALVLFVILVISICTFCKLSKIEVGEMGGTKQTATKAAEATEAAEAAEASEATIFSRRSWRPHKRHSDRSNQRGCGASKHGFINSGTCHPFTSPRPGALRPKRCGLLSPTTAGFCLCDDDEFQTTIATPKGCGTEPVLCEAACVDSPVVARKLLACSEAQTSQTECSESNVVVKPTSSVLNLFEKLVHTAGSPLGVEIPLGSRGDVQADFVMHGRRMSAESVEKTRTRVQEFIQNAPEYPEYTFSERGIVIVGGHQPEYQTSYWVAIHALRRSGCSLPIQLWFPESEAPDCDRIRALRNMGVTVHSLVHLFDAAESRQGNRQDNGDDSPVVTNHFMFKILALVFSSFQEVLFLDSDNIVLSDPSSLFVSDMYLDKGSIFWMDFWTGSSAPDLQVVLGASTKVHHTHESGQMLLDKKRVWEALRLAFFMNVHNEVFYPLSVNYMGLGDKEIIPMAFLHLKLPYGLVPHGPDHVGVQVHYRLDVLGNTMMQHNLDGHPMFMHTNLGKPTSFVPADVTSYVRRWQASNVHGTDLPRVISEAAGVEDFEMWYYELIRDNRCWFDSRSASAWYQNLGVGPFLMGFHASDHMKINSDLEAFSRNATEAKWLG